MSENYVYIIEHVATGWIKVGISDSPKRRLRQLQSASPMNLELRYTFRCDSGSAKYLEQRTHGKLWRYRRMGEWFTVKADDAADIITREFAQYFDEAEKSEAIQRGWRLIDERDWSFKRNPHSGLMLLSLLCWIIAVYGILASIYTHTASGAFLELVAFAIALAGSTAGLVVASLFYITWVPELRYPQPPGSLIVAQRNGHSDGADSARNEGG